MKTLKSILSLALAALMLISLFTAAPFTASAETNHTDDWIYYNIENSEVTITGYMGKANNINIPEKIEGKPVVKIAGFAFRDRWNENTVVTIPDSVREIENAAFYNFIIKTVYLPDNLSFKFTDVFIDYYNVNRTGDVVVGPGNKYFTTVDRILYNKNKTELIHCPPDVKTGEFTIPSTVKTIGKKGFYTCENITGTLKLPNAVTSIGQSAFYGCGLEQVILPASCATIGNEAFSYCKKLKSLDLSAINITSIGNYAFEYCKSATIIKLPSTLKELGKGAFAYCSAATKAEINGDIETIEPYTFENCEKLLSIEISASIKKLSLNSFSGCKSLISIKLPASLEAFETSELKDSALQRIEVDSKNPNFKTVNGVLYSKNGDTLICCPPKNGSGIFTIPSTVKKIGMYAFEAVDYTGFNIPNSVNEIDWYAFSDITVDSITLPESVTKVGRYAFNRVIADTITFPGSLKVIPAGAVYKSDVRLVVLNEGVEEINMYAFSEHSTSMIEKHNVILLIKIPKSAKTIGALGILGEVDTILGEIPSKAKDYADAYKKNFVTNADWEKANEDYSFKIFPYCCAVLNKVNTNTKNISISNEICGLDITEIDSDNLFEGLANLETVDFSECEADVKKISEKWFKGCYDLKSVTLPYKVKSIDERAFSDCHELETVKLNTKLTDIKEDAFINCENLKTVSIPNSVERIGDHAFGFRLKDGNYEKIDGFCIECVPGSAAFEYAGKYGFDVKGDVIYTLLDDGTYEFTRYCDNKKDVVIPESFGGKKVTAIGENAFLASTSIRSVTVPEGVRTIADDAFRDCENLQSVSLPSTVESIGEGAFFGVDSLEEITVKSNNPYYTVINNILYNKDNSELIICAGKNSKMTVVIPAGVEKIDDYAFINSRNLLSVTLPEGLKVIGDGAFYNCPNLQTVDIPSSVTEIGDKAFGLYVDTEGGSEEVVSGFKIKSDGDSPAAQYSEQYGVDYIDTTAPETEPTTENNEPTVPEDVIVFNFLPDALSAKAEFRLALTDSDNNEHNYDLNASPMTLDDIEVRTARAYYSYTIDSAAVKQNFGGDWIAILRLTPEQLLDAQGKIMKYDGSFYGETDVTVPTASAAPVPSSTEPAESMAPSASTEPASTVVTGKAANTIKVTVKAKTIKLKKLKNKAQKVKALTVKDAKGKVSYKLAGVPGKLKKLTKISSKGVITIKRWKKAKKGTYKIKVKITAKGNSNYYSKSVIKTVKIKVK